MRILFVSARPPWPARRGDQARLAGWLRALGGRHEIAVLSVVPPGFPADPGVAAATGDATYQPVAHGRVAQLAGILRHPRWPLQVAMHHSPALERAFDRCVATFEPDVIVPVLSRVGWVLERAAGVPVVLDLVDSLARNLERRARREPLIAPALLWEARRMRAWDQRVVARAAGASVVSDDDRRAITRHVPELVDKVSVVPFGLDVPDRLPERPVADPPIVLLSGNLGYFPTVDAAVTFARDVWHEVRERVPDARWWLAGARPASAVRRLAGLPGVRVEADPDDLAAIRDQATVAIAPLRAGSGTPIKILEAMACGLPVVTTTRGAEGLDDLPEGAVAVADSAEEQVDAIVGLLGDPEARRASEEKALAWVRLRHRLDVTAARLEEMLSAALD